MSEKNTRHWTTHQIALQSGSRWLSVRKTNGKLSVGIADEGIDDESRIGWSVDLTTGQARQLSDWLNRALEGK